MADSDDIFEVVSQLRAEKQRARLPAGRPEATLEASTWDPRLALELALQFEKPEETFKRYGYTPEEAAVLLTQPAFQKKLIEYRDEIQENGLSFRLKARAMAEELLGYSYILATDADCPPAVRADLIKWTAKMGDLEPAPKEKSGGGVGAGSGFSLNITFSGAPAGAPVPTGITIDQGAPALIKEAKDD